MSAVDDTIRLQHMLEAALKIRRFARHRSAAELKDNELFALGVTRLLEIIGEAASHISETTCAEMPDIPWSHVVGMRNRLIHGYDVIDLDILWKTITDDLPPLIKVLRKKLT
jgi:uncharacterized protein with HEPN domain